MRRHILSNTLHEDVQENGQSKTNTARNYARFNLVVPFHLGRDALPPFQLQPAFCSLLAERLGPPSLVPVRLVRFLEGHHLTHGFQISPTKRAELDTITLIRRTARTDHAGSIMRFYLRFICDNL